MQRQGKAIRLILISQWRIFKNNTEGKGLERRKLYTHTRENLLIVVSICKKACFISKHFTNRQIADIEIFLFEYIILKPSIHPFIIYYPLNPDQGRRVLEPIPSVIA